MNARRNFLKNAGTLGGLMFCSCGMLDHAMAQTATPRRFATIKGKRVKTVDTHAHCYFQEAIDLMGKDLKAGVLPVTSLSDARTYCEEMVGRPMKRAGSKPD